MPQRKFGESIWKYHILGMRIEPGISENRKAIMISSPGEEMMNALQPADSETLHIRMIH